MESLTRRQFIEAASALMSVTIANSQLLAKENSTRRPNIVFVFADQMRAHAMGCMGNKQIITPNLDRLASQGLLVTNAVSATPVCSPYRAQLLTGRYGHSTDVIHNDIRLPDSEIVISELMKQQGYTTGYIGKWHLSGNRKDPVDAKNRRGWDFWAVRNCSHAHSSPVYWLNDSKEPVSVPGWEPEVQTDLAVEFIKKNKQSPFCLFMSFGPPHNPYKAPEKYVDMYRGKALKNRPNVPDEQHASGKKKKKKRTKKNSTSNKLPLVHYYAMTTSIDACMKRIADALDHARISRDTIVVFSSDHGDMFGSQGHTLKNRPWEESINIPFVVRYPRKVKGGQRRDWIVSSVDVMPTLLGLAGVPIPSRVQGLDYSSTFLGTSKDERDAAFLFSVERKGKSSGPGTDWRGIRTKEWTYAYHASGDWILYDLKSDPYQLKNLVDEPRFAAKKKTLRRQLEAMRRKLRESGRLTGKTPAPVRLPG